MEIQKQRPLLVMKTSSQATVMRPRMEPVNAQRTVLPRQSSEEPMTEIHLKLGSEHLCYNLHPQRRQWAGQSA